MGWSTSVVAPPDGDMGAYIASLTKVHDRDDRVLYPAHGPAIDRPRQLVRGMIGHRRQRERQIIGILDEAPHDVGAMVGRMYKGLDERLLGAARLSVLAHLIDLENRGEVASDNDIWALAGA